MTLTVMFGHGGNDKQWSLGGLTPDQLPNYGKDFLPAANALTSDVYTIDFANKLFNDMVQHSSTATGGDVFDVVGLWNSVKNAQAISDHAEHLTFKGFVHVDVGINGNDTTGSIIDLEGVKRSNVVTGAGSDVVDIKVVAEDKATWTQDFRIVTGAGDDVVRISGMDIDAAVAKGDTTFSGLTNMGGGPHTFDATGAKQGTFTSLGDGNDRFFGYNTADTAVAGDGDDELHGGGGKDALLGGAGADNIYGDDGNDYLNGGIGEDHLTGGAGHDVFVFEGAGFGADVISDFNSTEGDKISINGLGLGTGELGLTFEDLAMTQQGDDLLIKINALVNGSILLSHVHSVSESDFLFIG